MFFMEPLLSGGSYAGTGLFFAAPALVPPQTYARSHRFGLLQLFIHGIGCQSLADIVFRVM